MSTTSAEAKIVDEAGGSAVKRSNLEQSVLLAVDGKLRTLQNRDIRLLEKLFGREFHVHQSNGRKSSEWWGILTGVSKAKSSLLLYFDDGGISPKKVPLDRIFSLNLITKSRRREPDGYPNK